MKSGEQSFELPAISDCYLFNPTIDISHSYTGHAQDIGVELTVTDQFSRLKVKDNGVNINQVVKFSIVASPDLALSEKSNLTEVISIAFCKTEIKRI